MNSAIINIEPDSTQEALKDPVWLKVMMEELQALKQN